MHVQYPYSAPIILNDTAFVNYGGKVGDSLPAQRNAAYLIAEIQMTNHLSTFLKPTTVTGTNYPYVHYGQLLTLEHNYINAIYSSTLHVFGCAADCTLEDKEGCEFILDETYGYIVVLEKAVAYCECGGHYGSPLSVDVVYNAGLPTGTSCSAPMLLALTMAAQINLWEIIDPGALPAGAGDAGITQFSAMSYSEQRKTPGANAFGESALANKIALLVEGIPHRKGLKF